MHDTDQSPPPSHHSSLARPPYSVQILLFPFHPHLISIFLPAEDEPATLIKRNTCALLNE